MSNIFDDISDGYLEFGDEVMTEAAYPESIPYLKTVKKQVLLPQGLPGGKGNVCFLYSHNIDESIKMINNEVNFLKRNKYKFYYYPMLYIGKIYNKRFRFKDFDIRKDYYARIVEETGLKTKIRIDMGMNDNRNMFIDLFRHI